jgi:hypothetical protein
MISMSRTVLPRHRYAGRPRRRKGFALKRWPDGLVRRGPLWLRLRQRSGPGLGQHDGHDATAADGRRRSLGRGALALGRRDDRRRRAIVCVRAAGGMGLTRSVEAPTDLYWK